MENLGENFAGIITNGAGSLSCLYNLQGPGDQWVYYNGGTSAWTLANVGDVSIQCLSGIINTKSKTHTKKATFLKVS